MLLIDVWKQVWPFRTKRELQISADGYFDYIELPGADIPANKEFYGSVFG